MSFRYRKIQREAKAAFTKATKFFIRNALWRLLNRLLSLFPEKASFLCAFVFIKIHEVN